MIYIYIIYIYIYIYYNIYIILHFSYAKTPLYKDHLPTETTVTWSLKWPLQVFFYYYSILFSESYNHYVILYKIIYIYIYIYIYDIYIYNIYIYIYIL